MKKVIIILAIVTLAFGCAGVPTNKAEPIEIKLNVQGVDTVKVEQEKNPIRRSMEIKNTEGELSSNAFINGDTCYYTIWGTITKYEVANLWKDLVFMKGKGIKKIYIYLNSGGGSAFDGMAYADQLRKIQPKIDVTIQATGIIASAAVPIFAVGGHRIATRSTMFMLHQGKMFKMFAIEGIRELTAQKKMMEMLEQQYTQILVDATNLSFDVLTKMQEVETWFTVEEAKGFGLVDEIQ